MLVVHTQFDSNSFEYALFSMHVMNRLKVDQIEFRIKTLGRIGITPAHKSLIDQLPISSFVALDQKTSSGGHAMAIEASIADFSKDADNVICDSDTVVLTNGWDRDITNALRVTGIIGTTYESIGGFSSGSGLLQTYKDLPNVVWAAFSRRFNWSKLKADPKKSQPIFIKDSKMSQIYNLPIGYSVLCDVCWQLPSYIDQHQIPAIGLKQIKPSSPESIVLKGCSDYHEEYHFPTGRPFVIHQRGSMKHAFRRAELSKHFYDKVDAYLASTTVI